MCIGRYRDYHKSSYHVHIVLYSIISVALYLSINQAVNTHLYMKWFVIYMNIIPQAQAALLFSDVHE